MPTRAQASKPPANLAKMVQVDPPVRPMPPPDLSSDPGYSSLSISSAPGILSTPTDAQRQFYRRGVSQQRTAPLPPQASIAIGATGSSQARAVVAPVAVTVGHQGTQINQNTNDISSLKATSFQGAWSNTATYSQGASVDYSGIIYISLIAGNVGNTPSSSPTDWVPAGGSASYQGVWSGATAYTTGQLVSVGSALYIALQNSTNKNPTSTTRFWQLISGSSVYRGAYSGSTAYNVGDEVSFTDGNFYVCISATTGNAPSTTSSFWTLLGTSAVLLGNWSSSVAYKVGNQVVSGGNIYTATAAGTNHVPPNASFWQLLGPQTLDNLGDGSTRFGAGAGTLSYAPTTTGFITATDIGSSVSLAIAGVTVRFNGKFDVTYSSGSVLLLNYATKYYVVVSDAALAGGSKTFSASTSKSTALGTSGGNIFLGSITTPAAGQPPTADNGDGGSGTVSSGTVSLSQTQTFSGTFTDPNPIGGIGNQPGAGTQQEVWSGMVAAPTDLLATSKVLQITSQVVFTSAVGTAKLEYSINGGNSYAAAIYTANANRGLQTDSVTLSSTQDLTQIRVRATVTVSSGTRIQQTLRSINVLTTS